MFETLLEQTSLPNLHPAVVHFPIAFLPLALAFEAAGLFLARQRWLARTATTLYVAAVAAAWLAVWAGRWAADGLVDVPTTVQPHIAQHSDWAHYTGYGLLVVAILRLVVHLHPRLTDLRWTRGAVLVLGAAVLGLLAWTADLGGGLVYRHGLGVEVAVAREEPAERSSEAPASSTTDQLTQEADGTLVWQPTADDGEALATVLTPATGTDLDAVRWVEDPEPGEASGLVLEVDGEAVLLLPGTFGDVQVELTVEAPDFEGIVGVVHHATADGRLRGVFQVSTTGEATLARIAEGNFKSLDRRQTEWTGGESTVAVSAVGRHLKGLIDGRTVTHGHIDPAPEGACGLLLAGRGHLRILHVRVIPVPSH